MQLSPQQQKAVDYLGSPTLVIAGAGSGKTRTLTAKIASLIDKGYSSRRILAITFTNKAAEEMKKRLLELTRLQPRDFPWVRTFHSACFQILKAHCDVLGYQKPLQVYSTYQQQKLIRDILVTEQRIDKKYTPMVAAEISHAKNSGDPLAYLARQRQRQRFPWKDIFTSYQNQLKVNNALDFDNILLLTRDMLKQHPELRTHYQNYFEYILCDEYQDTNNLQEELTALLMRDGNLFCVGDDWQAIYSFRGSNVNHFLSFKRKHPQARVFRLEENFRSAHEIVDMANHLINQNQRKMKKTCFSSHDGGHIHIMDYGDEYEEAEAVKQEILRRYRQKLPLHQMAVLYRTKFCSLTFEHVLRKANVPYFMLGGKGFFERMEIMDLNAYLMAAAFERDDASFERIINTPRRGIGNVALKKIMQLKQPPLGLQEATRIALQQQILPAKIYEALRQLLDVLEAIRTQPPGKALNVVIQTTGYLEHLEKASKNNKSDYISRKENIEQLLATAGRYERLEDYLEDAALVQEDRAEDPQRTDGVRLATIHAAKGLEFDTVFVVGCEESLFPHWRSLDAPDGLDEERRLMYVAITRAARHLYLSACAWRKGNHNPPSRFLGELREHLRS